MVGFFHCQAFEVSMVDPIVNSFAVRTWLDSPAGQSKLKILQVICSTLIMGVATLMVFFMLVGSNLEKGILLGVTLGLFALMAARFPTKSRFLKAMGASE